MLQACIVSHALSDNSTIDDISALTSTEYHQDVETVSKINYFTL